MSFVHLGIRSEYAIVDSIVRINQLVKAAAADNQHSLALADYNNMFAAVKFYKACVAAGIKPILGAEVVVGNHQDKADADAKHSVILYAMDNNGYQNLLRLISDAYTSRPIGENGTVVFETPIITKEALAKRCEGLIAILTHRSEIASSLLGNNPDNALPILQTWQEWFGDRLYIGIRRIKTSDDRFNENAIIQASKLGIAIVAHNDVRFINPTVVDINDKNNATSSDFDAHEARVCIASGYTLGDKNRPREYSEQQYFKSQDDMAELFVDLPQVIENTALLASRCNVTLTLGINVLPDFPIPEGESIASFFRKVSVDGLNARLDKLYPPNKRGEDWAEIRKGYDDRLDYELDIILKMGFPGYFLIVMDFIRWAKANGVPVGPGRGSGAGSLVAYALNITDLDPLRYDLLFERFLNPERVSMPDFDIDFCIEGRDRVIDYVAQTYGRQAVSQIITFGTMAARAVVRDVTRVQGKPFGLGDRISKLIPKTPGISLDAALEQEPQLKELLTNPEVPDHDLAIEIWEMAKKLEGITRNVGKHAGGVLIAPNRISDFSAVYCDSEGHPVSQFDKDDVEAVGLVKFDFLGLRNLTVIQAAIDNINHTRKLQNQEPIDLDELPLDDEAVYQAVLQEAKTTAVFQLESTGMKKYLAQLKPSNIEDVIAMCALYRPGPLESGMVSDFIERKHGIQEVAYPHPQFQHELLKAPLEPTYGVIVYQEQVMQIAQMLAGYTLGGADMLRRAMGKKKPEEMAKQRSTFVEGAVAQNIDGTLAAQIFDLVEKFAGYGFNKSHSAAYGVLAYQTAYLKHYYPAEFMAAVLTSEMDDTDQVVFLLSDCKDNFNLNVIPPSVNHSQWKFVVRDAKTIVYGLGAVKGVGEEAVNSIVAARKDGPFKDLYDFCNRVDIKKVGKRSLEALIKAGCFDILAETLKPHYLGESFDHSYQIRRGLWRQLPDAMATADQNRQNQLAGTMDLFAEVDDGLSVAPVLEDVYWHTQDRLRYEQQTIGLYLTGHPLDEYRSELGLYTSVNSVLDLKDTGHHGSVRIAGLIFDVAFFGNRIVVKIDDGKGRIELSCYGDTFNKFKEIITAGKKVRGFDEEYQPAFNSKGEPESMTVANVVIAKISVRESDDGRLFYRLLHIEPIEQARLRRLKEIHIKLAANDTDKLNKVLSLLKENSPPPELLTAHDFAALAHDEDGEATSVPPSDLCVPIALYLYDECSISRVQVNERFRLYPSDDNISKLKSYIDTNNLVFR
ncbi:DNA polymerase-3 subunit alpha [Moraxella cuniculi DSM 21768]|uniref:DNA polymerase III subunit alpha n=2 Tax=Moraxella cuniculi TaxID=34061 RepID=A0A1N7ETF1_9GAMM|nr:DNA polymerase III subunit alpha [Moraxella cuniculi]OOS06341.1 DNA polymerase III subunit alpha [Moraxella cuniculi]SIR91342.1 DNA polymerase-3 subunit alpha [Moraxella cuniculi DSM 21768]VEG13410.1 DNA polymerase III subunit alpha [Moraxella cuniculi]